MKAKAAFGEVVLRAMLILALVVGLAPLGEAQTLAAKGKPAAASAKSQASAKPPGGSQEGIKVHGHWTIVIKNPDGSTVSRHEFDNALVPGSGDLLLAAAMSRNLSAGYWIVQLGGAPRVYNGAGGLGTPPGGCFLTEPNTATYFQGCVFPGSLTVQGPSPWGPSPPFMIVLTGSPKSTSSLSIDTVTLYNSPCTNASSPSACGADPSPLVRPYLLVPFTLHTFGTPIAVQAGQTVDVTVTISFS